jgi:hypothetical protein
MQINDQDPQEGQDTTQNEDTSANGDQMGENAGDSAIEKGSEPNVQNKPDDTRVETVVPDNDSGDPGPSTEDSSNTDGGPSEENL